MMNWEGIGNHVEKIKAWNPLNEIPNEEFQYIDLSSINKDAKIIEDDMIPELLGKNAPSRAKQRIQMQDIIVSTVRPNLNGVSLVNKNYKNATASTGYCVLRTKETLYYKYLFYWVQSKYFIDDMIKKATGASYPAVSDRIIKESKIPLPPLPTQKKIAAILDQADKLRQLNKQLIKKYDELSQSLFLDMFGDLVNNQKGWDQVTVRNLVSEVKYGTSSKAVEGGKYPYLRMNNITYKGYMDYSKLKYIDIDDKDKHKYLVKKGDVLFNRTNSKELVGKTGIIQSDEEAVIAGYLIRVRVNELANPFYIWGHLNSRWAKLTLNNMCKNIVGMANINAQELQDIIILKAPKELQNQFATRIQAIEAQKAQAQESLKKSEDLFNSLLQRAFKGELVG